jgi:hypothetical protein
MPELWNPMTGQIHMLAQFVHEQGKTKVPVRMEAEGAAFIVFRESSAGFDPVNIDLTGHEFQLGVDKKPNAIFHANGRFTINFLSGDKKIVEVKDVPRPIKINGPWQVAFSKYYGFDSTLVFDELTDWKDHSLEEIKYYSGTANYTTTFEVEKGTLTEDRVLTLNLGDVSVAARVFLNGKELAVVWKAPFICDVSENLNEGMNDLKIEVANVWTNRLIGDERFANETGYNIEMDHMPDWYIRNQAPDYGQRKSFCAFPFYKQDDPLLPSGLLGPVQISISKIIDL